MGSTNFGGGGLGGGDLVTATRQTPPDEIQINRGTRRRVGAAGRL
jgi:hypothetical protein